eukprot:10088885-Lingulodinium_polyedra.AAC.1
MRQDAGNKCGTRPPAARAPASGGPSWGSPYSPPRNAKERWHANGLRRGSAAGAATAPRLN